MSKNIVILCDGTSNQIGGKRTNVLRLYGALQRDDSQHVFYDPGVGTFGVAGIGKRIWSAYKRFQGLALGVGIDDNVLEAYRYLVSVYEDGDRVYLFGFSRGAYTVRLLAGFIRVIGLISQDQMNLLEYAYRAYKRLNHGLSKEIKHYQKVLQGRAICFRFMGLWDTVASVFEPRPRFIGLQIKQQPFTDDNDRIEIVRHAVAIDERRTMFRPSLWKPGQHYVPDAEAEQGGGKALQDFQEVWFAGCHGDVGGGNIESRSTLAKVPLIWLFEEACAAGLQPDRESVCKLIYGEGEYTKADPLGVINETFKWYWWPLEFSPRPKARTTSRHRLKIGKYYLPLRERRRIDPSALIHISVKQRIAHKHYDPPNLPKLPNYIGNEDPRCQFTPPAA